MPKRSSRPKGENADLTAARITAQATGAAEPDTKAIHKNPAAVELGRLGGLKGGKARAAKLTKEQRSAIARKAAAHRWGSSHS